MEILLATNSVIPASEPGSNGLAARRRQCLCRRAYLMETAMDPGSEAGMTECVESWWPEPTEK
jgi:hypothetical protein